MFLGRILTVVFIFISLGILAQRDSLYIESWDDEEAHQELVAENKAFSKVDSVLSYAEKFLGVKYGFGSTGTNSFDCSGFVLHVYKQYGVALPHGSGSQVTYCQETKLKNVRPGDLLFFSGRKISKHHVGHVAIVKAVNGNTITMIHATVQAGVIVEDLDKSEYFSKRFIKAGRISALQENTKGRG